MSKGAATSTTALDPQLKQKYLETYSGIQNIAQLPFTPYTGDRYSGPNPDDITSFDATRGMFGDSMSYNPRGMLAQMGTAPLDISQYQNPYQEQVINASLNDLDRARQLQQISSQDRSIAAGAFGGDRSAILEGEADRAFADAAARSSAQLRSQGFDKAAGLGMMDRDFRKSIQSGMLGDQYQTLGMLGNIAGLQRGLQDRGLEAQYDEFGRVVDYPLRQAGLLSSAISGLPFEGTETARKKTGVGDVLGGLFGLGTAMAMGGVGPFGENGRWS